jgi:hypothetical protein
MKLLRGSLCLLTTLILVLEVNAQADRVQQSRQSYNQAIAAYKKKDFVNGIAKMEEALRLRPNHPGMMYDFACIHSQAGNSEMAVKLLRQIADMGISFRAAEDRDFSPLKDSAEFQAVVQKLEANRQPIANGAPAFSLPERDLLTEGVAYDPITDTFFVGSVHQRKIVAVKDTARSDFSQVDDGLWGVFGMAVDSERRRLWVATSALPQMAGFSKELADRAAVSEYDLSKNKLVQKYIPADSSAHLFGDLLLNSKGDVLVSDSRSGGIYRISPLEGNMELLIAPGHFASLQGLAFLDDENWLFAADYSQGIFRIDTETKSVSQILHPETVTLLGIDGLYFYKGSLIAIQNGVNPQRVIRLWLNEDSSAIERAEILDANHPDFDEPTLGVIVDDAFYYVARSQWGSFDDNGKIKSPEALKEPVILRTAL